jgi:hypothetical protein
MIGKVMTAPMPRNSRVRVDEAAGHSVTECGTAYGPLSVLRIFRSVVDDPAPRYARPAPSPSPPPRPGEADVIIGRPEPESANNNPLKRNGAGAAGDLTIVRPAAVAPLTVFIPLRGRAPNATRCRRRFRFGEMDGARAVGATAVAQLWVNGRFAGLLRAAAGARVHLLAAVTRAREVGRCAAARP